MLRLEVFFWKKNPSKFWNPVKVLEFLFKMTKLTAMLALWGIPCQIVEAKVMSQVIIHCETLCWSYFWLFFAPHPPSARYFFLQIFGVIFYNELFLALLFKISSKVWKHPRKSSYYLFFKLKFGTMWGKLVSCSQLFSARVFFMFPMAKLTRNAPSVSARKAQNLERASLKLWYSHIF